MVAARCGVLVFLLSRMVVLLPLLKFSPFRLPIYRHLLYLPITFGNHFCATRKFSIILLTLRIFGWPELSLTRRLRFLASRRVGHRTSLESSGTLAALRARA
jgi:hypothetical protein